jgi:hypothetical protein
LSRFSAFDNNDTASLNQLAFCHFQLSPKIRGELADLLTGEIKEGNWQALAEKLGLDRHIPVSK